MKAPSPTLVSLCVAFPLFNYQINGGTNYQSKQVNMADKIFQTVPEKCPRLPNQSGAPKHFGFFNFETLKRRRKKDIFAH